MTQQKAGTGEAPVPNPTGMVATIPFLATAAESYLDQPATGGLPAPDGLLDLREEAGGVRLQVRIQKVTGRSPRAGRICDLCRDFVLLWTSHFPPHLPVELVDNSTSASAARSSRRVRRGEGASVRKALPSGIPSLGEARRGVRKEREFPR